MMNRKAKGINAERELVKKFWDNEWAAMRAPASGASRFPSPDVIAGNCIRRLAIECKSTADKTQYLSESQMNELKKFCDIFGAEPWIGVRFDKQGWFFLSLDALVQTQKGYKMSLTEAKLLSLSFEEMIAD